MNITPPAFSGNAPKAATRPAVPEALADVALVDGPTCAAAASISLSSWHERVRTGEAPAPVVRAVRCTRWRLAEVRRYLQELPQRQSAAGAERLVTNATAASRKAAAKRTAEVAA